MSGNRSGGPDRESGARLRQGGFVKTAEKCVGVGGVRWTALWVLVRVAGASPRRPLGQLKMSVIQSPLP